MAKFDEIDVKILQELLQDSNQSIPKLSKKIGVNTSVVYSRIKRLVKRGLIKRFTIEVDEDMLGYPVSALVGVNVSAKARESVMEGLKKVEGVREIYEVTGRFDFVISVRARGLEQLHEIISKEIGMLEGIDHTETFISLRHEVRVPSYFPAAPQREEAAESQGAPGRGPE